ncbi:hypothetical protein ACFW0P_06055 [Lysobacter soli]|uniref:hypothetical protein n=1 Tax=Lysobacter soli TaxID=453783 RepID=UPI00367C5A29
MLSLSKTDTNFDYLAKSLAAHTGEDSAITSFARNNADSVRYLVDLRNYNEHPKATRTLIEDFRVLPDGSIEKPTWRLAGEKVAGPHHIRAALPQAVDFLRDIAEAMVIHLVMHQLNPSFPYYLEELSPEEVDTATPIRYRLLIDFAQLQKRALSEQK